jgi:hypothetical protein
MTKAEALEKIRQNIFTYGHHVYLVGGGPDPRFVYTIGLSEAVGFELIFAGGTFYHAKEAFEIIERLASILKDTSNGSQTEHALGDMGTFSLREAHPSWSSKLIWGAMDYYKLPSVPALQIVPDAEHFTIDVPNLSQAWSETAEPIWQWLEKPWDLPVPQNTMVMTDLAALRGEPIIEAVRWEEKDWELFATPYTDLDKKDGRAVPLGTLLGADPSLRPIIDLAVGKALRRDPVELEWHNWPIKSSE